ncbi:MULTISPECIES: pyrroline-5-carboxylate reductase [unclassified Rhizobium]|uniref:pyrroline-5-carboxylate reductase n=1 Tax=unclassified Rhizobium TaxID=2613769 RepID=UPI0006FE30E5|nr:MULTISPECIES: pyrroline-5-carboxylate reductase [unclassified Rhizobium]KQV33550.1 pyrroline-5-carboxylate reductase [Rhizobium sp. Root1212]KRD23094.1 pyrroline-5-carboxylate reductase [Rhizobium sp. Root268]
MTFGFVGTGNITEAIVAGILAGEGQGPDIVVSPRSAATAARLAALSPKVLVGEDNQHVVDAADMVFLAIRPDVAEAVVRALRFRPGQRVVSLVATVDHAALRSWIDVPVEVVRAIPLPFVATRSGVTAIFPPDPAVEALFSDLGTAVACETIEEYDLLATASALMGSYFGIMDHAVGWLTARGMPETSARAYLASLFSSLSTVAKRDASRPLEDLRHEYSTKGGLNEQIFTQFREGGGLDALTRGLDSVLDRIRTNAARAKE